MSSNNLLKNLFREFGLGRALKNLPDAVMIVNFKGEILWLNNKATTIFEGGKKLLKSYNFDDLIDDGLNKADKSVTTRTPVIAGAFTPNSKEFFVELNAKEYKNRYIITLRDISAMTNILTNAEQTQKFNQEKNSMLVKLSNEIKSPLNSIVGFSQALIDGLGGEVNEKQDKYIKIINKNSSDLMFFMEKFIEFSYAESSLYEYDFQTFDIVNTIQNVVRSNYTNSFNKGLNINFNYDELTKRAVYTDEKTLKIIMQNLLDTSIKLTDTGSINIKIKYADEELVQKIKSFEGYKTSSLVHISITDTGIGLAETEMQNLFEPYNQLEKTNKKNIVRSIELGTANILTKRISGVVWAESEVMKGTTFNLIIPVEKDFLAVNE